MSARPTLLWLRQDLRLDDHPALRACAEAGPVVPVFVWSPEEDGDWPPGAASRWWLHHSLVALEESLRRAGSRLIVRRGPSLPELRRLAVETGAKGVAWQRAVEPARSARDERVQAALRADGLAAEGHEGALLVEPRELRTSSGGAYQVFTPFWRALRGGPAIPRPVDAPRRLASPGRWPESLPIPSLELLPRIGWDAGPCGAWTPGEAGARRLLDEFVGGSALGAYDEGRDRPARPGTSRLSPHLHAGEISPRRAWHAAQDAGGAVAEAWLRQLAWREFSSHALAAWPDAPEAPIRASFQEFPWRRDARALRAWQQGRTGYPWIDAGMRELWATGWMHNRVRMAAASFLVKHLLLSWQEGERWFWDTLVDADLANNAMSWQWVAGCGLDAAPYFRIFNPVLQGRKFDPQGDYVRRWVPELAELSDRDVHAPWLAAPMALAAAGVTLGRTYPRPIVDHAEARNRALDAFASLRRAD